MIKDKLKELFLDKAMLTEVKDGLIAHLQRAALEDVFGGTEVVGYKQAGEALEDFFKGLESKYSEKRASSGNSSV
jgi:hypothetical protein